MGAVMDGRRGTRWSANNLWHGLAGIGSNGPEGISLSSRRRRCWNEFLRKGKWVWKHGVGWKMNLLLMGEDGALLVGEESEEQLIAEQGLPDLIELPVLDTRHARRDPVLVSPYRLTPCPAPKVFTSRRA